MRVAVGCLAMAVLLPAAASADETLEKAGKTLAQEQCSSCHAVANSGGSDAAPSFASVANKRDDDYLRAFLAKPHGAMPAVDLSNNEVEAIIAYIESLKK